MRTSSAPCPLSYRRDVNGLRAIAIVSVVAFHVEPQLAPGGFVGVDIFFVISGYLISRIIMSEVIAGDFSLRNFYARRVRRIFPALAIVLAAVWIAGYFWLDPPAFTSLGQHQLDAALYVLNFRLLSESSYFAASSQGNPLLHLWSLSIEEQFYTIWPALLLALARLRLSWRAAVALIIALSFGFNLFQTARDPTAAFYLPWGRVWELALGAAVAHREVFSANRLAPGRGWLALAGLGLMLGAIALFDQSQSFPGWRAAAPTIGCALVIAFPGRMSEKILGARPMQFLGGLSYPFYLWHWPVLAFAFLRVGEASPPLLRPSLAALALVLAALTNRVVERPVFAFSVRRQRKAVFALAALLVTLGLTGLLTRAMKGFPRRYSPQVAAIFDFPPHGFEQKFWRSRACYDDRRDEILTLENVSQAFAPECLQKSNPNRPTILLLGDSHAAHLYPGLLAVFGDRANVLQLNASYCAPLVETIDLQAGGATATQRCRLINQYAFQQAKLLQPDIVVVGAFFGLLLNGPGWTYKDFVPSFIAGAATLKTYGVKKIVIAGQVPTWTPTLPSLVAHEFLSYGASPHFSKEGLDTQSLAVDLLMKRQDFGEGVVYVSLIDQLCGPEGCRRRLGDDLPDDLMAIDYGHLSTRGSTFVARELLGPAIDLTLRSAEK